MNELRIELRTRNNRLWHEIFDHYANVREFCQRHDLDQSAVGAFLNLSRNPYSRRHPDRLIPVAAELCVLLKTPDEDLFPKALYDETIPHTATVEIPLERFVSLTAARHLSLPPIAEASLVRSEAREAIVAMLGTLTEREEIVLRAKFGLLDGNEHEHTLEEIGKVLRVSRERVRQIESKAMRKMRHLSRSRRLWPVLESFKSVEKNT